MTSSPNNATSPPIEWQIFDKLPRKAKEVIWATGAHGVNLMDQLDDAHIFGSLEEELAELTQKARQFHVNDYAFTDPDNRNPGDREWHLLGNKRPSRR